MKDAEKRLGKVFAELSDKERVIAILDAMNTYQEETSRELFKTAPRKTYTSTKAEIEHTVDAILELGLRFDRTAYSVFSRLASNTGLILATRIKKDNPGTKSDGFPLEESWEMTDEYIENMNHCDKELRALVVAAREFGREIGLSLDRILAFSIAKDDSALKEYFEDSNEIDEDILERAKPITEAFRKLWQRDSFTLSNIEKAA